MTSGTCAVRRAWPILRVVSDRVWVNLLKTAGLVTATLASTPSFLHALAAPSAGIADTVAWALPLAVFVIFFAVGVYPILAQRYHLPLPGWLAAKQLKLGLDLKGGVHLVLRVQTDEALKIHTTTTSEQLREALRTATAQSRALEDQRATLQAKLTTAEQERDRIKKQNDAFRAQVKEAEQAYRQAVKDFNERIAERDDTLEKWKSAYGEAASVARTKDAERTKFEGEATALKAVRGS